MLSKFNFSLPSDVSDNENESQLDKDGDLVVKRLKSKAIEIGSILFFTFVFLLVIDLNDLFLPSLNLIFVEHKVLTNIHHVGYQVWRGALLLADFIIYNEKLFCDKIILEVGSGVGLTSIVAAKYSKEVICTGKFLGFFL